MAIVRMTSVVISLSSLQYNIAGELGNEIHGILTTRPKGLNGAREEDNSQLTEIIQRFKCELEAVFPK